MQYERETKKDKSTRHVIYQLECLMLALKESPITCRLLITEITNVARENYARAFEASGERLPKAPARHARPEAKETEKDISKESMYFTVSPVPDARASTYWQQVQDHVKQDTPQFVTNRKKSSLIRQTLFSLEDVLLAHCPAQAHKGMVEKCQSVIDRFAHKMLHMRFENELPDLDSTSPNKNTSSGDPSQSNTSHALPQDYHDVATQLRQSEEIVDRAEKMLGLTDTFRTLGVPARLNGVLAAVKRISDRNALLEEQNKEVILEGTMKEMKMLEERVQELAVENIRLQDQLKTAEELIQSLTEHEDFEHKQATPSRHLHTEVRYITKEKDVFLPFENVPLHCERSVVQAVLSFLTDPYPQFEPFCSMANSCMWPTTADECPRDRCVGCRRHEYRVDAVNRLRGVCDDLLAMKIQTEPEQEGSSGSGSNLSRQETQERALSEVEQYGFVLEEEVKVWEEKMYVQWTRGPLSPPAVIPPEEKESAEIKALHKEIKWLQETAAMDQRSSEINNNWDRLVHQKLKASEDTIEKLRAAAMMCLLQVQRLESAVHPTNPATFPDSRRTQETLEGVPQRLLGVIKCVSELQKENNKLQRVATGLEERVADLKSALSCAEAELANAKISAASGSPHPPHSEAPTVSSPPTSPAKTLTWKAASTPVSKAIHGARKMLSSPSRSRPSAQSRSPAVHPTAPAEVDQPTEIELCAEVVSELEKLLNHGNPSPASPTRGLFTRLTCVLDGMRDLYFQNNNAVVERHTMELEAARSQIRDMEEYFSDRYPRRSQVEDFRMQLFEVVKVLAEHRYVPIGCTNDAIVQSGEIPHYMKRMGDALTRAKAAMERMLQEGIDSKATDTAGSASVWSADSVDVVRSIKQAITSHLWPASESQSLYSHSSPRQPPPTISSPAAQPSLEADEKSAQPSPRVRYHRHLSRRGIVEFTQNAARNNPPKLSPLPRAQDKQYARRDDYKWERKGEAKHVHYADAGEKEAHNMKMSADSKPFHRTDDETVSDRELDSEEERQVQRLLQEMYDEEALQGKGKTLSGTGEEVSAAAGTTASTTETSNEFPPNQASVLQPTATGNRDSVTSEDIFDGDGGEGRGEGDVGREERDEPEPRESDVSATGSEHDVGFVLI